MTVHDAIKLGIGLGFLATLILLAWLPRYFDSD